jgi:hypothetical protein
MRSLPWPNQDFTKSISNKINTTHTPLSHLIAFTVIASLGALSQGISLHVAFDIFSVGDCVFGSILQNSFCIITKSFRLKYDASNQAS